MLNVFGWLRVKARDAMLAGIGDAVEQVAAGESPDLEKLRALVAEPARALPAKDDDEPAKGGKRGGR